MIRRITLYADEGMVLTDGESYCNSIVLAEGNDGKDFKEITQEEYEIIKAEEEKRLMQENAETE